MDVYKNNIEALKIHRIGLYDFLNNYNEKKKFSAEFLQKNGVQSLKIDNIMVCSAINPKKEAQKIIESSIKNEASIYVFLGMGMLYHVFYFLNEYLDAMGYQKNFTAVILEEDPIFFKKLLYHVDLTQIIGDERIFISFDVKDFINIVKSKPKIEIIKLKMLKREFYEDAFQTISLIKERKELNRRTLKKFSKLWVSNLIKNTAFTKTNIGIEPIKNLFEGKSALILAAGPSLDDLLNRWGAELKKKFLIIAVDTSLSCCLRHGLDPDFTVVVDPQFINTRHFDRCEKTNSIIVSEPSTHPRVFRMYKKKQSLVLSSVFPLGIYLEQAFLYKGKLLSGGSVSTQAFDLARHLGIKKIYIAGLDLGFPNKRTHFKGSFFEETFFSECNRLKPASSFQAEYIASGYPYYREANYGGKVLSDMRMQNYINWFENELKVDSNILTHNLSKFGSKIKGMEYYPFEKISNLEDSREDLDSLMNKVRIKIKNFKEKDENIKEYERRILTLKGELEKVKLLSKKCYSEITNYLERKNTNLLKLEEYERDLIKSTLSGILSFLMQDAIEEIYNFKGDGIRALENNLSFYKNLEKACENHLILLNNFAI